MTSILSMVIPALIPAATDAVRGVVNRLTGGSGANPQNVDEAIKLMDARAKWLQAMADLDRPAGNISQWVVDLRASFRYVAAGVVVVAAISTLYAPVDANVSALAWEAAQSVWAFIFGDRMYSYIKRGK